MSYAQSTLCHAPAAAVVEGGTTPLCPPGEPGPIAPPAATVAAASSRSGHSWGLGRGTQPTGADPTPSPVICITETPALTLPASALTDVKEGVEGRWACLKAAPGVAPPCSAT